MWGFVKFLHKLFITNCKTKVVATYGYILMLLPAIMQI